jgi:hypothetical protein
LATLKKHLNLIIVQPNFTLCKVCNLKLVPNWFQTSFKQVPNRFQTGYKPVPNRFQTSSKPVPNRFQTSSKLVPNWFQTGSKPVPNWFLTGSKLVSNQFHTGSKMVPNQFQTGSKLVPNWFETGSKPVFHLVLGLFSRAGQETVHSRPSLDQHDREGGHAERPWLQGPIPKNFFISYNLPFWPNKLARLTLGKK